MDHLPIELKIEIAEKLNYCDFKAYASITHLPDLWRVRKIHAYKMQAICKEIADMIVIDCWHIQALSRDCITTLKVKKFGYFAYFMKPGRRTIMLIGCGSNQLKGNVPRHIIVPTMNLNNERHLIVINKLSIKLDEQQRRRTV